MRFLPRKPPPRCILGERELWKTPVFAIVLSKKGLYRVHTTLYLGIKLYMRLTYTLPPPPLPPCGRALCVPVLSLPGFPAKYRERNGSPAGAATVTIACPAQTTLGYGLGMWRLRAARRYALLDTVCAAHGFCVGLRCGGLVVLVAGDVPDRSPAGGGGEGDTLRSRITLYFCFRVTPLPR